MLPPPRPWSSSFGFAAPDCQSDGVSWRTVSASWEIYTNCRDGTLVRNGTKCVEKSDKKYLWVNYFQLWSIINCKNKYIFKLIYIIFLGLTKILSHCPWFQVLMPFHYPQPAKQATIFPHPLKLISTKAEIWGATVARMGEGDVAACHVDWQVFRLNWILIMKIISKNCVTFRLGLTTACQVGEVAGAQSRQGVGASNPGYRRGVAQ